MKIIFALLLLSTFLTPALPALAQELQGEKRVIFLKQTPVSCDLISDSLVQRFTPSLPEIDSADLAVNNHLQDITMANGINLRGGDYFRQYAGIWWQGQKLIFINASCRKPDYFMENTYHPKGGGECYFRALVDINTKKISRFSFNAPK